MTRQRLRHLALQKLFWNPAGARLVPKVARLQVLFDTVVRGYSLIGDTNGERWLITLMDETPVALDVGFHAGDSTAEILKVRPKARVFAFDPSRFGLQRYRSTFADDERVSFANVALSSAPGELEFHDYDNMCNSLARRKDVPGATPAVYKIPVTTVDAYLRDNGIGHINFMKVDAEGYDLHVLEGARETLGAQGIDIFMFEFASGWAASKRYLWEATEYLARLPYRLFHLYNGFLSPLVYDIRIDSCCTLPAMYVGVSEKRFARGDIPTRNYRF